LWYGNKLSHKIFAKRGMTEMKMVLIRDNDFRLCASTLFGYFKPVYPVEHCLLRMHASDILW
jgi:hypothetical protein